MPNPRWNNMHGANDKSGGGHKDPAGSSIGGSVTQKTASWPGLPGKTQPRARNAGVPKTGAKGPFRVKAVGL